MSERLASEEEEEEEGAKKRGIGLYLPRSGVVDGPQRRTPSVFLPIQIILKRASPQSGQRGGMWLAVDTAVVGEMSPLHFTLN